MSLPKIIIFFLVVLHFTLGAYLYPHLPAQMASHWNAAGEVDGYIGKFWGTFLMPIIALALVILFMIIPRLDPLRANIKKFKGYFEWFIVLILAFFFYLYILTLLYSFGKKL